MRHSPEIQEVSIVVIGSFTPEAISPSWLAFHGLISAAEADEATLSSDGSTLSQIDLGWGKFFVGRNRIQFFTSQSPWVRAKDFILKLLIDVIPSAPSSALGINITGHYPLSFHEKERLGHRLAPREPWGDWGGNIKNADADHQASGLTSITMRQGVGLDCKYNLYIDVNISSSNLLKPNGVRIYVNDHYDFSDSADAKVSPEVTAKVLDEQFDLSLKRSNLIMDGIIEGAKS